MQNAHNGLLSLPFFCATNFEVRINRLDNFSWAEILFRKYPKMSHLTIWQHLIDHICQQREMKFIHNYLCPLNQCLQSETFCEIFKHCAQCVSSSSLKWRVDPRFSYWVYLQSQLNSHVKTRSLEQFSSRFPMNTFNYRSLVGILEFLWKNACGIFWARVIRKTYDGEFGHLNLILETWN